MEAVRGVLPSAQHQSSRAQDSVFNGPEHDPRSVELAERSLDDRAPSLAYEGLDASRRQIRLLRLSGTVLCESDDLAFELTVHSLSDTPHYQALSYTWGTEDAICTIIINGCTVQIRPNLYRYLRLRRDENDRAWLYVDAVCINQLDLLEKSTQVALMGDVYRNATEVVAWLGAESIVSEMPVKVHGIPELWQLYFDMAALKLVPEATEAPEPRGSDSTLRPDALHEWLSAGIDPSLAEGAILCVLDPILDGPYWTRLWVVQEMLLAQRLIIRYKRLSIPWRVLYECLRCGLHRWSESRTGQDPLNRLLSTPIFPHIGPCANAIRVCLLLEEKVRSTEIARAGRIMLSDAIHSYAEQDCTLQCDKIYGLYGVLPREGPLKVDYQDPHRTLHLALVAGLVEIRSVAQIDRDMLRWQAKSGQYICRLLGLMGEELHSPATTASIKVVCKCLGLNFRNVSKRWAIMGVNWKEFHGCRTDTLLGKAGSWYHKTVPHVSEKRISLVANLLDSFNTVRPAAVRDATELEAAVTRAYQASIEYLDFDLLQSKTDTLLYAARVDEQARLVAEEHVVHIEHFPIPQGATRLAYDGVQILRTALTVLSDAEDEGSRPLADVYTGFCTRLQAVIERADETTRIQKASPQAQRDVEHIVGFVDRRRLAIARVGFDWVPNFDSLFPLDLSDSSGLERTQDYPRWVHDTAQRMTGGLPIEAESRNAQLKFVREGIEGDDKFAQLTRMETYLGCVRPGRSSIKSAHHQQQWVKWLSRFGRVQETPKTA